MISVYHPCLININSLWPGVLNAYERGPFEIVMVFVVTIGVFFLAWLAARFLARRSMQPRRDGLMHMADRLMLGKDKQIILLKVGHTYYLVGLSQNSIQFSQPVQPEAFADLFADKQKAGDLFTAQADDASSQDNDSNVSSEYQTAPGDSASLSQHHLDQQESAKDKAMHPDQQKPGIEAQTGSWYMRQKQLFSGHRLRQGTSGRKGLFALIGDGLHWLISAFQWRSRWQAMKHQQSRRDNL